MQDFYYNGRGPVLLERSLFSETVCRVQPGTCRALEPARACTRRCAFCCKFSLASICIYIYIYMYIHIIYMYIHIYTCVYMYVCIHMCILYIHICIYVHTSVFACVCIYIYYF